MNLNQLSYFVSVAELLNFTRAAERHFISQTAITQQIRALEETVGVPLFIRDRHHVELTPAGRVYLKECRIILDRANDALRMARLAAEGVEGELNIGYINGYGHSDFSDSLRRFHRAYPGVRTHLFRGNSSILLAQLERGEIDAALVVRPFQQTYPGMEFTYLRTYPVMAVLDAGHPLATRASLSYSDLKNENFIMMEPSDRPLDQMEESLLIYRRGGFLPNVVAIEGEPETLMLMVSAGMGISILPEYLARPYQEDKGLRILPMRQEDGSADTVDFTLVRSASNMNPALGSFLEMMR